MKVPPRANGTNHFHCSWPRRRNRLLWPSTNKRLSARFTVASMIARDDSASCSEDRRMQICCSHVGEEERQAGCQALPASTAARTSVRTYEAVDGGGSSEARVSLYSTGLSLQAQSRLRPL